VPLVLDTAAAAARPSPEAIASWASQQRVFISSVMGDLREHRHAVAYAIRELGAHPVWFEEFGGRDEDAERAYLAEVESCSIYVGILGRTYGRLQPSRFSATHLEYREAEKLGLRIAVWVAAADEFQGDQDNFVQEVRMFHTTGSFHEPADLATGVATRLLEIASEDLSPWVKVGDVIFRANQVSDDGINATIAGTVHSSSAAHALEQLRPSGWAQGEVDFTMRGTSRRARVEQVATTTTASRAIAVSVRLGAIKEYDSFMRMSLSVGGKRLSADEVTDLRLREVLFGESLGDDVRLFGGQLGDPLEFMPTEALPHATYAAVLGLLLTHTLVASGRAKRVLNFRLAPAGPKGRRVAVEWLGDSPRHLEGVIAR